MRYRPGKLLQLFWSFFKLSPASFGGGYAMIPNMEREIVDRRNWMDREELVDIFAIAGSLPGTVAINSSTFIGYRLAGIWGAIIATFAVLLPTFLIVLALCTVFLHVQDIPKVQAALEGIKIATIALIAYAGIRIAKAAVTDKTTFITAIVTFLLLVFVPIHPVVIIAGGAVIGIVIMQLRKRLGLPMSLRKEETHSLLSDEYYMGGGI